MIHRRDAQDAEKTGGHALAIAVGCRLSAREDGRHMCGVWGSGFGVRESGKPPLLNPESRTLNPEPSSQPALPGFLSAVGAPTDRRSPIEAGHAVKRRFSSNQTP